jgi:EAL domain-containing protein (putative c-di-GMP-specific phosphodiesterase class I)
MTCLRPANEPSRLAALHDYAVLDTPPDRQFDTLVGLASRLSDSPIAALSFVDKDRQWYKSRTGFDAIEAPRDISFCAHAILEPDQVLVVEDARHDSRFATNPFVTGAANIRFYAGAPVVVPNGHAIGTLCVLDHQPKTFPDAARQSLRDLAAGVAALLELHRRNMLLSRFVGDTAALDQGIDRSRLDTERLETDLRVALANDDFHLLWQPLVKRGSTARQDSLIGFEALLRLGRIAPRQRSPAISPGTFIPVAEAIGLIRDIDRWVLRAACKTASSWRNRRGIAVNVSGDWFRDDALPGLIAAALRESQLDPARLEIEVTERMLIADRGRGLRVIRAIQDLGVAVALDDFGSCYSSLSYVMSFPFDKIKLDRAFISEIGVNPRAEAVTRASLQLARQLGIEICAEGVETSAQLEFLRAEGCDLVQGYLIGRPARTPL